MDQPHGLAMDFDNALRLIGLMSLQGHNDTARIRELEAQVERQQKIIKTGTGAIEKLAEEKALLQEALHKAETFHAYPPKMSEPEIIEPAPATRAG